MSNLTEEQKIIKMQEFHKYCTNKSGKCLEKEYKSTKHKYKCICKNNHKFELDIDHAKKGRWCRLCAKNYIDPKEEMQSIKKYCITKNGQCLENVYKGSNKKYKCICKNNHIFWLNWNNAKQRGNWCKFCAKNYVDPKKEIQEIHKYCEKRCGLCLEKKYKKNNSKYKCKCKNNHIFYLNWNKAKTRGDWCSECSSSFGENFSRWLLEKIFGYKFNKIKPNWLLNNNGNKLELDGYCEELKIAFEYQGGQHYRRTFGMTEEEFKIRQQYDKIKKEKCSELGILLIEIPEFKSKHIYKIIEPENLESYILEISEKYITDNNIKTNLNIDIFDFYSYFSKVIPSK